MDLLDLHGDDFEAEIAIARTRLREMDWGYLADDTPEDMTRGAMIIAYAQFHEMVDHFGDGMENWHKFLQEGLAEVIAHQQRKQASNPARNPKQPRPNRPDGV